MNSPFTGLLSDIMSQKRFLLSSSPLKRPATSEMLLISYKPGLSSCILSKQLIFIIYFFFIFASSGYIFLSVNIFKRSTKQLFYNSQLGRKNLYIACHTLLADSIEQFFINTLRLPHQQKTTRSLQELTILHEQHPAGSSMICPTTGWISSHFGMRTDPIFEGTAFHKGIDIAAPEGTPVYCSADGVVEFCGNKPHLGNVVYVQHPQKNLITIYGHLRACRTFRNAQVSRGQLLGYVGSTGKSTGPHLHFEVRHSGRPVNPIHKLIPLDTLLD